MDYISSFVTLGSI